MGLKGYRLWVMGQLDSTCRAPPQQVHCVPLLAQVPAQDAVTGRAQYLDPPRPHLTQPVDDVHPEEAAVGHVKVLVDDKQVEVRGAARSHQPQRRLHAVGAGDVRKAKGELDLVLERDLSIFNSQVPVALHPQSHKAHCLAVHLQSSLTPFSASSTSQEGATWRDCSMRRIRVRLIGESSTTSTRMPVGSGAVAAAPRWAAGAGAEYTAKEGGGVTIPPLPPPPVLIDTTFFSSTPDATARPAAAAAVAAAAAPTAAPAAPPAAINGHALLRGRGAPLPGVVGGAAAVKKTGGGVSVSTPLPPPAGPASRH
jgi:hypothetical protein